MARPMRVLGVGAIITVVCVAVLAVGGYVLVRFTDIRVPFISDTCRAYGDSGSSVTLKPEQLGHAATIAAVGTARGVSDRGIAVALATALQESKLRNLSHGDRDSVGLFQQRPSQGWGTADQLQDPHYASSEFYTGLARVQGWQEMSITDAAQAVQLSAHPDAYAKWEPDAQTLSSAFSGDQTQAVTCELRSTDNNEVASRDLTRLRESFARDYESLGVELEVAERAGQGPTLTLDVAAADEPVGATGWRAAHWMVAKSREYGVRQVAFDGASWSSSSGKWRPDSSIGATQLTVRLAD